MRDKEAEDDGSAQHPDCLPEPWPCRDRSFRQTELHWIWMFAWQMGL